MKNFNQKALSAMVSMLMTLTVCDVATVHASDIEIYKLPDKSKITLFLMFDTSGSMGVGYGYDKTTSANNASSLVQDYNVCSWSPGSATNSNIKSETKTYKVGSRGTQSFSVNYCAIPSTNYNSLDNLYKTRIRSECPSTGTNAYKCYDRLSRLKMALANVLSSNDISNDVLIGLGQFSTPTDDSKINYGRTGEIEYGHDSRSGRVIYPAVALTDINRENLIKTMVALDSYNGTPSASAYGESGAYFLGKNTRGLTYSGYSKSTNDSRDGNNGYKAPLTAAELKNTCNGQGIYFLTDGLANNSDSDSTKAIMNKSVTLSGTGLTGGGSAAGWTEIGQFAKLLREENRNIKTAVVGFGSDFPNGSTYVKDLPVNILDQNGEIVETVNRRFYDCAALPAGDVKNTCNWGAKPHPALSNTIGGFGNGGFYSAKSDQDIVNSIKYFIDDIRPRFKPIATGSPTIPVDALNPIQLQPYGYYSQFTPKPQELYQLWLGNLNKYHIFKGQLYNNEKNKPLINASTGKLNADAYGIWGENGVLGKLPLGTFTNPSTNAQSSNRVVFTNRKVNESNLALEDSSLQQVNLETLFSADATKAKFKNDPKKNYWLNALGYKVAEEATGITIATLPTEEQRQLGAVMHSKPVLLTQEGKIVVPTTGADKGKVTTTDRKDYLLFGSTQGMLHVVNVDDGKEVFAFVPHEMMENQANGFLSEGSTNGGKDNLYYGIDGAWTAFTHYVSKTDKTLTVKDSGRKDSDDKDLNQKGLQWVYGGLRMGGRSYYGLDLGNITSPSLKFHIDPANSKVINSAGTATTYSELGFMGQSWSKPTVTYVNWGGTRRLVMLVGGGYDSTGGTDGKGYENPAYEQSNKKGAGVYMFDAGNGELLWWASANVTTSTAATTTSGVIATKEAHLKYSVVSQINAIDRDGDGLSDILYFGDLGGQAFRVDINNKATTIGSFAQRIVRLYAEHQTDGTSPRFYEMPSFSVHKGVDGLFGVVALSSGNRSSPLAGTNTVSGSVVTTKTANDAVYVIYDNDVARSDLYALKKPLRTSPASAGVSLTNATFANLKAGISQTTVSGSTRTYNGGWNYQYSNTAGKYKGMNELYTLDGMLYVNVYHKDGAGISGSCGSGVIGDTELYQFCLPTGKCSFYAGDTSITSPSKVIQGGGILGATLGQGFNNNSSDTGIVVKRPSGVDELDCNSAANKNKPECQLFDNGAKLRQLRWYESR